MSGNLAAVRQSISQGKLDGLTSPSFLIPPPEVRHAARIPPETLEAMTPAWQRVWFAPAPLHITVLENVFVAQEGLVLRPDGEPVEGTVDQHSAEAVEVARRALRDNAAHAWRRITGDVVLCRKPGLGAYGHWLVELLPKALLASQLPQPKRFLIQSVSTRMASLIRQSLTAIGVRHPAIIEASYEPVWVERLILVSGLTSHGNYMSPLAVECLQMISDRIEPSGSEALFVTRPPNSGRGLVDETRITNLASEAGFRVLEPGSISFTQQIAAFKAARKIVGVMGSALANLAFAQPGTDVSILAPANMPDTFFWFLSNHRQLRLTEIRCHGASACRDASLIIDEADEVSLLDSAPSAVEPSMKLFDSEYYAAQTGETRDGTADLLAHYMELGWKQGRSPSRDFDGDAYLARYGDVRAAGLNPLFHYLKFGRSEGRVRFAV